MSLIPLLLLLLPILCLTFSLLPTSSSSAVDTLVFGGCSQLKYAQGSPYENSVNSMLTSLVNSATFTTYNNFTIPSSTSQDALYGLFQCRGDLNNADCGRCVANAVSQLGNMCANSCGGALQLDGCFVKYDNTTFLGVEDKTVLVNKCGPSIAYDSDALTRRDALLGFLAASDGSYKPYRVAGSGDVAGVAQCVGDLSASQCQDCLSDAIGRLKTDCGASKWGNMYLAKCYALYSKGGDQSNGGDDNNHDNNDDESEKTLAILIGAFAGVALLIVLLFFLIEVCDGEKDCADGK
ncbi:plasmodesmata-located protein 6-like [Mangifera indica]|uniref:plasmodesmata-located protein 6-like n=1 Tax=Mangifera indica TaxID=29780 RepID=UPI001CFA0A86|nr:plasmodesmata-located protein 6-like [Mangifera indica]